MGMPVNKTMPSSGLRLLVTGAGGLLGGRLAEILAGAFHVIAARHEAGIAPTPETVPLDLLDERAVQRALDEARPDAVVHSAALADADRCEREPDLARRVNVEASAFLARVCRARSVRLVALSTDLVCVGDHPFATEDEVPQGRLVYTATKIAAEQAMFSEDPGAAVMRVALVHGRGFGPRATSSESVAWALRAGRPLRLYTDQYRTPVDPESVADAAQRLVQSEARGLFHIGGPERLSRYELGLRVADVLGLPRQGIEAVTTGEHPQLPARPRDVSLDHSRASRELGYAPRPVDVGIREGRETQA
jgi:dTDP-4-dehydrorhamnose reductase